MAHTDTIAYLKSFIEEQSIPELDDTLLMALADEQRALDLNINQLLIQQERIKERIEALWRNDRTAPYELTSVFVHRGSTPSFGHYFFYSRNLPRAPNVWFKYNDSEVTEVSPAEVLADTTGSTANPYLVSVIYLTRNLSNTI